LEEVTRCEVSEQTRLREDRDVRRVAALSARTELRLEVLAALVLDLDVVRVGPVGPGLLKELGLVVDDRAVHGNGPALATAGLVAAARCGGCPTPRERDARCAEDGQRREPPITL